MSYALQNPYCAGCLRFFGTKRLLPGQVLVTSGSSASNSQLRNSSSNGDDKVGRYEQFKDTVAMMRMPSMFSKAHWRWSSSDLPGILKTVGSLNLELPRSWSIQLPSLPKKLRDHPYPWVNKETHIHQDHKVHSVLAQEIENPESEKSPETSLTVFEPQEIIAVDRDEIIKKHRRKLYEDQDLPVEREQHDFSTAMSIADACIRSYHNKNTSNSAQVNIKEQIRRPKVVHKTATKATNITASTTTAIKSGAEMVAGTLKKLAPSRTVTVKEKNTVEKKGSISRSTMARSVVNKKTRDQIKALKLATSTASKVHRLEEICNHLKEYPEATAVTGKENLVSTLLKMRKTKDKVLQEQIRETLCLVGYIEPVKGDGIRVLSMDGGGTRGLATLEILKELQALTGKEPYETFDYIIGVSTGALLAVMIGVFRIPLEEIIALYKMFSKEMFSISRLQGARQLVTGYAYYDAQQWEKILQEQFGLTRTYLDTVKDAKCPKIANVTTVMNQASIRNFLFRNYNYPARASSAYPGSPHHCLWEGIRGSSAAPLYYAEFKVGNYIHQDGGLLTNNPTSIAVHECKLLWPQTNFQCVLSLGTGKYEPDINAQDPEYTSQTSLKTKIQHFVQSATDTEAMHVVLQDLLPPEIYFRFNPYLSEDFDLAEVRQESWDSLLSDTHKYLESNEYKLKKAAEALQKKKPVYKQISDWMRLQSKIL